MGKNIPGGRTPPSMLPVSFPSRAAIYVAGDMGLMFFLLRMAFWLGLVLILSAERLLGASRPAERGQCIASDFRRICHGRRFAAVLHAPARCLHGRFACGDGTRLQGPGRREDALRFPNRGACLEGRRPRAQGTSKEAPKMTGSLASGADKASQNTLTPADLVPAWRASDCRARTPDTRPSLFRFRFARSGRGVTRRARIAAVGQASTYCAARSYIEGERSARIREHRRDG